MGKNGNYFELKNFKPTFVYSELIEHETDFLNECITEVTRKAKYLILRLNITISDGEFKLIKILNSLWQSKMKGEFIMDYTDNDGTIFFSRKYSGVALMNNEYLEIFDRMTISSETVYKINVKFIYDFYKDFYN